MCLQSQDPFTIFEQAMNDAVMIMNCYLNAQTEAQTQRCRDLEAAYEAKYSQTLFMTQDE